MKKFLLKATILGSILGIFSAIVGLISYIYFSYSIPDIKQVADYTPKLSSQILSSDGTILADIGIENREIAKIEEMPEMIIDAFVSAEDDNFFEHTGVDYYGILRALWKNILAGRVVQGGSTITQQVAKSLLENSERSISRKIKDILLAQKLEKHLTKKEILYLYVNQVYLGGGYYGVKAAFRGYFNKEITDATIAESAMIAGLLVAPGRYSPYRNPEFAKQRQSYVLLRMYENGKISKQQYEDSLNEKIKYYLRDSGYFKAGYFTDWVRQQVVEKIGEKEFLKGGYKVKTTLDYPLQVAAESAIKKGVIDIDHRQGFHGVDKTIPEEEIHAFLEKERNNIFKDSSTFFTLTEDYKKSYEYETSENDYFDIVGKIQEMNQDRLFKHLHPGNIETDQLNSILKTKTLYDAVVLSTNNYSRTIFVAIGSQIGVIPYKYFRWAHTREIAGTNLGHKLVTHPSTIVKRGDIIKVMIHRKSISLRRAVSKNYSSQKTSFFQKPNVLKQRYLLCSLEQLVEVEGALFSINPKTGDVLSFVGGKDFKTSQFNRVIQSLRQPGSSFKPFIYAAALENGYAPNSIIIDSPEALDSSIENLSWKPQNYDGKFKGPITLRESLEKSRNVTTIKIAQKVGVSTIIDFSKRIGINAKIDHDLSLSLGSFGITLFNLVSSYAVFANNGVIVEPRYIVSVTDRNGITTSWNDILDQSKSDNHDEEKIQKSAEITDNKTVFDPTSENVVIPLEDQTEVKNPYLTSLNENQVYDKRLAYIMSNLLQGVVKYGTGRRASRLGSGIGGKTGTTNNYVDAWFVGFSPHIATGVWTGFDENKTLGWGETGSKSALPIWTEYMKATVDKFGETDFIAPRGIINIPINKTTGKKITNNSTSSFTEAFTDLMTVEEKIESVEEYEQSKKDTIDDDDYFDMQ